MDCDENSDYYILLTNQPHAGKSVLHTINIKVVKRIETSGENALYKHYITLYNIYILQANISYT